MAQQTLPKVTCARMQTNLHRNGVKAKIFGYGKLPTLDVTTDWLGEY
jgi:hypothetical protein